MLEILNLHQVCKKKLALYRPDEGQGRVALHEQSIPAI